MSSRYSVHSPPPLSSSSTHAPPLSATPSSLYSSSSTPLSSVPHLPSSLQHQSSASSSTSRVPSASLQQTLFGGGGGGQAASGQSVSIVERNLNRMRGAEVGAGAMGFLLMECVRYSQERVDSVTDLEKRLAALGYECGTRILALLLLRTTQASSLKDPRRDHRLIPILQFVHTQVYKFCFGKPADGLERSVEGEDEYMLTLNQPPLTQHMSVPKDMSQLSCEAFTAGIVEAVLDGLDVPARVTAHTVPTDQYPQRTVILIKLDPKVMDREEALGK